MLTRSWVCGKWSRISVHSIHRLEITISIHPSILLFISLTPFQVTKHVNRGGNNKRRYWLVQPVDPRKDRNWSCNCNWPDERDGFIFKKNLSINYRSYYDHQEVYYCMSNGKQIRTALQCCKQSSLVRMRSQSSCQARNLLICKYRLILMFLLWGHIKAWTCQSHQSLVLVSTEFHYKYLVRYRFDWNISSIAKKKIAVEEIRTLTETFFCGVPFNLWKSLSW